MAYRAWARTKKRPTSGSYTPPAASGWSQLTVMPTTFEMFSLPSGAGTGTGGTKFALGAFPACPGAYPAGSNLRSFSVWNGATELAIYAKGQGRWKDGSYRFILVGTSLTFATATTQINLTVKTTVARTTTDVANGFTFPTMSVDPTSWNAISQKVLGQPDACLLVRAAYNQAYVTRTGCYNRIITRAEAEALPRVGAAMAAHHQRTDARLFTYWWDGAAGTLPFSSRTRAAYTGTARMDPAGSYTDANENTVWKWNPQNGLNRPAPNFQWRTNGIEPNQGSFAYYDTPWIAFTYAAQASTDAAVFKYWQIGCAISWFNGHAQYNLTGYADPVSGLPAQQLAPYQEQNHKLQPAGHGMRYLLTGDTTGLEAVEYMAEWLYLTGTYRTDFGDVGTHGIGETRHMTRAIDALHSSWACTRPASEGTAGVGGVQKQDWATLLDEACLKACNGSARTYWNFNAAPGYSDGDSYWHSKAVVLCPSPANPAAPTVDEYGIVDFMWGMLCGELNFVADLGPASNTLKTRAPEVTKKTFEWWWKLRWQGQYPTFTGGKNGYANGVAGTDCAWANHYWSPDQASFFPHMAALASRVYGDGGLRTLAERCFLLAEGDLSYIATGPSPEPSTPVTPDIYHDYTASHKNLKEYNRYFLTLAANLLDAPVPASHALDAVATVDVSPTSLSLVVGGAAVGLSAQPRAVNKWPLTGLTVTWSSSDTSVATVNSSGQVTPVGAGNCTITASTGGKSGTCSVGVNAAVQLDETWETNVPGGAVWGETNTGTGDSAVVGSAGSKLLRMTAPADGDTSEVPSVVKTYDLTVGRRAWWEFAVTPNGGSTAQINFLLGVRDASGGGWFVGANYASYLAGASYPGVGDANLQTGLGTYDPANHRYLGIYNDGTYIRFQVSSDPAGVTPSSWVDLWSILLTDGLAPTWDTVNLGMRQRVRNGWGGPIAATLDILREVFS